MFEIRNKTILVISPQAWGTMYVSKHHYALELAKRGNNVYFLNPPEQQEKGKSFVKIECSVVFENLHLIYHRLPFSYNLKFRALNVFHLLMRFHVQSILKAIAKPVEVIWSFDLNNLYPFSLFPKAALKIFHPVDEPLNKPAIDAAAGATNIFSVTNEILDKYKAFPATRQLINHGVTENFIHKPRHDYSAPQVPRVVFSGNLLRRDIDQAIFIKIVDENPNVQFDCWGHYSITQTNLGGNEDSSAQFIKNLQRYPNVILHGAVEPAILSSEINKADAFLICYDVQKDQSKGTNYHKIMESLGTGKVIISNNITTYSQRADLVQMVKERDNNKMLPSLFKEIMATLAGHNTFKLQEIRISYASSNTYQKQIDKIENFINISRNT